VIRHCAGEEPLEVHGRPAELYLALLDAVDVEQVVDEAGDVRGLAIDDVYRFARLRTARIDLAEEQQRIAYRSQWISAREEASRGTCSSAD
jgi:hypothetical protein